jgi:hypothetical protein
LQIDGIICSLHVGIPFFVFCCVVTKELLQKEDPLNQNIQLFQIYLFFSDFTNNPESRDINMRFEPAFAPLQNSRERSGRSISPALKPEQHDARTLLSAMRIKPEPLVNPQELGDPKFTGRSLGEISYEP